MASRVLEMDNVKLLSERTLLEGQKLTVVEGDISKIDVDAVVHPTSGSMDPTGQVGSSLAAVGGQSLKDEIQKLRQSRGSLALTGAAICPSGGNLPSRNVIHVYSPSWGSDEAASKRQLVQSVESCLACAAQAYVRTLAFPSIGSGGNRFPKDIAARTILEALREHFSRNVSSVQHIFFVLFDKESLSVYNTELGRLKIDGDID